MAQTRRTLKINQAALIKHLQTIETHGLFEQGSEIAVKIGRDIFYWQKGAERVQLSPSEVSQQIHKL